MANCQLDCPSCNSFVLSSAVSVTNYIFQTGRHPTHYTTKWPWYSSHQKVGSVFPPLISEFTCDRLGANRNVAEVTLHDFPSLVWKGEATSPWLIRALALEPWAVQLPKATGLWGSLNYPRWRDLMEKPWDYVERKREMLGRTLAPTDACWSSSSHCRTTVTCETHTRTAYHCPSQISDPQKLWSDLIHCTRNSTTPPGNTTLNTVLKISGRREEDGNSLYYMLNVLSAWNCLKKKSMEEGAVIPSFFLITLELFPFGESRAHCSYLEISTPSFTSETD